MMPTKAFAFVVSRWLVCLNAGLMLLIVIPRVLAGEPPPRKPNPRPWASQPDEPPAKALSLARSAEYLDRVTVAWIEKQKCASCHTGFPYLMAQHALGDGNAIMALRACDAGAGAIKSGDPLAGSWVVVSTTNSGKDDAQLKDHTARFAGGKVTFANKDGKEHAATYTLDPSKQPATIDLVPNDGPHRGKTLKGIFTIEKGQLVLCIGKEGENRPTALSSKAGDQRMLFVLRKISAAK